MEAIFLRVLFPFSFTASLRYGKLRPSPRTTPPASLSGRISWAAFRMSHMRASFMEGTINVTYDLVDDSDRCERHFLSSALPGDGGVGVMTRTHAAYGSQFQGHLGSRAVESSNGITSSPHRTISSNGRTRFIPSMSPVLFFFFLLKNLFLILIEERCQL